MSNAYYQLLSDIDQDFKNKAKAEEERLLERSANRNQQSPKLLALENNVLGTDEEGKAMSTGSSPEVASAEQTVSVKSEPREPVSVKSEPDDEPHEPANGSGPPALAPTPALQQPGTPSPDESNPATAVVDSAGQAAEFPPDDPANGIGPPTTPSANAQAHGSIPATMVESPEQAAQQPDAPANGSNMTATAAEETSEQAKQQPSDATDTVPATETSKQAEPPAPEAKQQPSDAIDTPEQAEPPAVVASSKQAKQQHSDATAQATSRALETHQQGQQPLAPTPALQQPGTPSPDESKPATAVVDSAGQAAEFPPDDPANGIGPPTTPSANAQAHGSIPATMVESPEQAAQQPDAPANGSNMTATAAEETSEQAKQQPSDATDTVPATETSKQAEPPAPEAKQQPSDAIDTPEQAEPPAVVASPEQAKQQPSDAIDAVTAPATNTTGQAKPPAALAPQEQAKQLHSDAHATGSAATAASTQTPQQEEPQTSDAQATGKAEATAIESPEHKHVAAIGEPQPPQAHQPAQVQEPAIACPGKSPREQVSGQECKETNTHGIGNEGLVPKPLAGSLSPDPGVALDQLARMSHDVVAANLFHARLAGQDALFTSPEIEEAFPESSEDLIKDAVIQFADAAGSPEAEHLRQLTEPKLPSPNKKPKSRLGMSLEDLFRAQKAAAEAKAATAALKASTSATAKGRGRGCAQAEPKVTPAPKAKGRARAEAKPKADPTAKAKGRAKAKAVSVPPKEVE